MMNTTTSQQKLPKKALRIAHFNRNTLKNKSFEVTDLLFEHKLLILAISETHLDSSFQDSEFYVKSYNIFRNDRNRNGGGVAFYIQNHLPVKIRSWKKHVSNIITKMRKGISTKKQFQH